MLTLWDLLPARLRPQGMKGAPTERRVSEECAPARRDRRASHVASCGVSTNRGRPPTAGERYDALTRELLQQHGIRVRRWRSAMSGVAWEVRYRDGSRARLIESPRPKGPMSAAIFLHEVGHHVIGLGVFRPRCLEEYHAWAWAIREMERRGVTVTDGVRRRMHNSLAYAVGKARRRGLESLPAELGPYQRPIAASRRGLIRGSSGGPSEGE